MDKITLTQTELDAKIAAGKEGLLTQEQFDSGVKERLNRENKKYANYDELVKFRTEHEKQADEKAQKDLEDRKEFDKVKEGWVTKEKDLQGIITTKDTEISGMRIDHALISEVNKQNAYAEETMALLRTQATFDDNKTIRIKGKDANGIDTMLSIEDGVKKFLEGRPHLIKANKPGGGGTNAGTAGNAAAAGKTDLDSLNAELIEAQRVGDFKKSKELKVKIRATMASQGVRL